MVVVFVGVTGGTDVSGSVSEVMIFALSDSRVVAWLSCLAPGGPWESRRTSFMTLGKDTTQQGSSS